MFEKLCENLNTLMLKKRINSNELSRRTGLPASTIKKIRNCDNPNPTLATLVQIAKCLAITVGQLIGEEEILAIAPSAEINALHKIPVISWVDAMSWPDIKFNSYVSIERKYSDSSFALVVEEEDWENLPKGTLLIVDTIASVEHRDLAVVFKQNQNLIFLKKIVIDENKIYLKSLVPGCQIGLLTPTHKILGVVMEYRKHTKVASQKQTETFN